MTVLAEMQANFQIFFLFLQFEPTLIAKINFRLDYRRKFI